MAAALQTKAPPLAPAPPPTGVPVPTARPDPATAAPAAAPTDPSQQTESVTVRAPKPFSKQEMGQKYQDYEIEQQDILTKRGALKPPTFNPPKQPTPTKTDALETWGSSAMIMATIGSMFTRTPLTTSLNAAAAVMKAVKANDLETAQQNFNWWKASYDEYNKAYNYQVELYKSALTQSTADERASTAKLTAYLHAMSDSTALNALEQQGKLGFARIQEERARHHDQMQLQVPKMLKAAAIVQYINSPDYKQAYAAAKTPQEQLGLAMGAAAGVDPEVAKMMAGQAMTGDPKAFANARGEIGSATVMMARSFEAQMMRDQKLTPADISKRTLLFQSVAAGLRTANVTAARIGLGVAEMNKLMPLVKEASDQLKRTNYPTINSWINAAKREGGSKELKNLVVRIQGLQSAFSQVLTRGGVPTDAVRNLAHEIMNSNDPQAVLDTALSAMKTEAGAVEQAPAAVREELLGSLPGNESTPGSYDSPEAVRAAVESGALDEDRATQILKDDFGFN